MDSPTPTKLVSLPRELILSGMLLSCAVGLALPLTLWWAKAFAGELGMQASAIAAGLCWLASMLAIIVRTQFPNPQEVVAGTMGAMLVRMVVILGGGMMLASVFPELVKAALWGQIIVYFLLTLTVETLLAVRWVKRLEIFGASNDSCDQSQLPENGAKAI